MNIFGFELKRAKPVPEGKGQLGRDAAGQGPYTALFDDWTARTVMPELYEAMRESVPILDAAIRRLISLDGTIQVDGTNKGLVHEIEDWMEGVQVNYNQTGFQSFIDCLSNETYEQGVGVGEQVINRDYTDVTRLRVADSKDIRYRINGAKCETWYRGRTAKKKAELSGVRVENLLQEKFNILTESGLLGTGWKKLRSENLITYTNHNENQDPYGCSIMRSMEFSTKILLTIENALLSTWQRFGDPSYHINFQGSKKTLETAIKTKDGKEMSVRDKLMQDFNDVMAAKKKGKSADFVTATDESGKVVVSVIGADGQVLAVQEPTRHLLEQITAKTFIPSWLLGLHWSTTERLAQYEVEILLAEAGKRGKQKIHLARKPVETMLMLRGRAWKRGDFELFFELPNLHDLIKQAQARFLNAQADYYDRENKNSNDNQQNDPAKRATTSDVFSGQKTASLRESLKGYRDKWFTASKCVCSETKAVDDPTEESIVVRYTAEVLDAWSGTQKRVLRALGVFELKGLEATKTPDYARIDQELKRFAAELSQDQGVVATYTAEAFSWGAVSAAIDLGNDTPISNVVSSMDTVLELQRSGFALVKDNAVRFLKSSLIPEIQDMVAAGANTDDMARRLRDVFGRADYLWDRLTRSEVAMAVEIGKSEEWERNGVGELDFVPAPDACPICLALAGRYAIGKCPLPVRDTHPRCRCARRLPRLDN